MNETSVPFLCGGVLFFLLTEAVADKGSARDHRNGIKDEHSYPILMKDFLYAFTGSSNYGSPKDTSDYKECKMEGGTNIPLNTVRKCAEYDKEIRENYADALHRMDEFVEWHISSGASDWLVKALVEIIENDCSIGDSEMFFIEPDGKAISKAEIKAKTEFDLSAVLVGVLHFITDKRREKNKYGAATLDKITEKKYRKPRRYIGHLGETIERTITVSFLQDREDVINVEQSETLLDDGRTDNEVINDVFSRTGQILSKTFSEVIPPVAPEGLANSMSPLVAVAQACRLSDSQKENLSAGMAALSAAANAAKHHLAERIRNEGSQANNTSDSADDGDCGQASHAEHVEEKTTIIQQQTNVVQNGDHNLNVTNNGTMNFNF